MNQNDNTIDFLAIGDTATDVFIKLGDDSKAIVTGIPDTSDYRISFPFAAKIPYDNAVTISGVGNAPNAAMSAAKLGLSSALLAHIGNDQPGEDTVKVLKQQGLNTKFIFAESGKKTNYSYILWYGQERTILRKNEQFTYTLPEIGTPAWIYLSSVGSTTENFYNELISFLEKNTETKLAFQPGSKEMILGTKLDKLYKKAYIYFSNVEEAQKILGIETLDIKELLKQIHDLGPKIVVITDGPKGAYAFDGENTYFQSPYPDAKPPYERTGAGDAFSSTTAIALALGKDLPTALSWGAVNSMSVVQYIGAQEGLLSQEKIEEYLKNAPAEYKAKNIK